SRIQELENILKENQRGMREDFSGVARNDSREPENAQERGKKRRELSILLNLYQSMANAHVLAKQTNVPLEQLPWTELCALMHENVEALILNFHKANERVSHLEYICKHQTDTMNDLQQNQEDAFKKMSEQLKAQEHFWQKEKQYLEQQYSNRLAEIQARAQDCEETEQKNRQKLYGLEQICEQLAHENNSMKNTLLDAFKARSSLLAACALLSGALCPLYGRLSAMSCQRDILQEQVNQHQLLNQKIIRLLHDLPTMVESNQDKGRLRQRRAKRLVYVFRRAVIAVLAANRLRALARYSCTFFIWTGGSRGNNGIQVCVGESRGRHMSRFEEEGVDCIEALDWLSSSNLYTAIISSISELEHVLSKQDAHLWLSGHSLISAAGSCFAKLMDNLSLLMETAQGSIRGCRAYLERDSLIQRLARGLHRVNAQALEAGLYDRLPSTRNIGILQQEIFGFSQRLHVSEAESHTLRLQLAECTLAFSEMQRDAEKAQKLQEQLNELQHVCTTCFSFQKINKDNIHEELDNALQSEHEARLLLEEHQQRLQELSNRLELLSFTDTDKSQVSSLSLMNLPNATEELRRRKQVLDHLKRLLKDMEQDRQQLQETLQEAELAIQQGEKDEDLIMNRMKAVDAALNEHVLRCFMDLYSLAAARIEALRTGRKSARVHVEPEAAVEPLTPAPDAHWGELRLGTYTVSGTNTTSTATPYRTVSVTNIPSSVIPGIGSSVDTFINLIPTRTNTGPSMEMSSNVRPNRMCSVSAVNTLSSATPDRTGFGSSKDIHSHGICGRSYYSSAANIPSKVTPDCPRCPPMIQNLSTCFGSPVDVSSHGALGRMYRMSATDTLSSVTPRRTGIGSSVNTFINLTPTRTNTGSSVGASSHMIQNRALTVSSIKTPSNLTGNRTGTGSAVNTSFQATQN
ncbi:coiled-coil domain-containing protein 171-like, partial [Pyrgilauda ruficollis]|uniref:coiled-coil domain-containing protein 171-like n=1 Tax=Pyrgilauda ruficollis TaxID=221976 RepID=UPI001B86A353